MKLRIDCDELELIDSVARRRGLTRSELLRAGARREMAADKLAMNRDKEMTTCPAT